MKHFRIDNLFQIDLDQVDFKIVFQTLEYILNKIYLKMGDIVCEKHITVIDYLGEGAFGKVYKEIGRAHV